MCIDEEVQTKNGLSLNNYVYKVGTRRQAGACPTRLSGRETVPVVERDGGEE